MKKPRKERGFPVAGLKAGFFASTVQFGEPCWLSLARRAVEGLQMLPS